MQKETAIGKIKAFWKWIVSGIAVVGGAVWGLIQWLGASASVATSTVTAVGTGTALKTAVVTTAVVAAATAYTFSFGDKAGGLGQYATEAIKLIKDGKNDEAVKYVDEMIVAIDDKIAELEDQTKIYDSSMDSPDMDQQVDEKTEDITNKIMSYYKGRIVAEILSLDIKHRIGELSSEQLSSNITDLLNKHSKKSDEIIKEYLNCVSGEISFDLIKGLFKQKIPNPVKGELAVWLAQSFDSEASVKKCMTFYDELLSEVSDSKVAPHILDMYIKSLDGYAKGSAKKDIEKQTEEILKLFMSLFPDSDIGAKAAQLFVTRIPEGSDRDRKTVSIFEENANSKVADGLLFEYANVLIRRGKYMQALSCIDEENLRAQAKDTKELSEIIVGLAGKISRSVSSSSNQRKTKKAKKNITAPITPFSISVGLANQMILEKEYHLAGNILFTALEKWRKLPHSLVTGYPVKSLSDFGESNDDDQAKFIAKYLLLRCNSILKGSDIKKLHIEAMDTEGLPGKLKPYIIHQLAQNSMVAGDYSTAILQLDRALSACPISPVLLKARTECEQFLQKGRMLEKIKKQQHEYMLAAEKSSDIEFAVKNYIKVAELYLTLGNTEQAIGTHMLIVEKFPTHDAAPAALHECIRLLEFSKNKKHAGRIKSLKEKLLTAYPDSSQAKKYRSDKKS